MLAIGTVFDGECGVGNKLTGQIVIVGSQFVAARFGVRQVAYMCGDENVSIFKCGPSLTIVVGDKVPLFVGRPIVECQHRVPLASIHYFYSHHDLLVAINQIWLVQLGVAPCFWLKARKVNFLVAHKSAILVNLNVSLKGVVSFVIFYSVDYLVGVRGKVLGVEACSSYYVVQSLFLSIARSNKLRGSVVPLQFYGGCWRLP